MRHGLRTPMHCMAACCLQLGPQHMPLTEDAAFQRVAGLSVAVLAQSAPGFFPTHPA